MHSGPKIGRFSMNRSLTCAFVANAKVYVPLIGRGVTVLPRSLWETRSMMANIYDNVVTEPAL